MKKKMTCRTCVLSFLPHSLPPLLPHSNSPALLTAQSQAEETFFPGGEPVGPIFSLGASPARPQIWKNSSVRGVFFSTYGLSQNGFKTDSKRSQQSIEKISKNRYYPLKFLEFRVESPKGNEIKEIQNFKETTFFDMSSAQPADFRKSDKVSKKYRKIDITL